MIYTCQWARALSLISTYNLRIPPIDGTAASASHLVMVHFWQAHGYELKASVGAIMSHKVSIRLRYYHASANNYCVLPEPACVQQLQGLHGLQDLVDQHSQMDHMAKLITNSTWYHVCMVNVEYALYHDLAAPMMGGRAPTCL